MLTYSNRRMVAALYACVLLAASLAAAAASRREMDSPVVYSFCVNDTFPYFDDPIEDVLYVSYGNRVGAFFAPLGTLLWSTKVAISDIALEGPPKLHNGIVFAATFSGRVIALDARTGTWLVTYDFPSGSSLIGSRLAALNGVLFATTMNQQGAAFLNALTADSKLTLLWTTNLNLPSAGPPVVDAWGTVYVAPFEPAGPLTAVSGLTGKILWQATAASGVANFVGGLPAVRGRRLFFGAGTSYSNSNFSSIDTVTGSPTWTYQGLSRCTTGATTDDQGERVFFGQEGGHLFGLNASSGEQLWTTTFTEGVYDTPTFHKGKLYSFSIFQNIHVVEADTGVQSKVISGASCSCGSGTPQGLRLLKDYDMAIVTVGGCIVAMRL